MCAVMCCVLWGTALEAKSGSGQRGQGRHKLCEKVLARRPLHGSQTGSGSRWI